VADAENREIVQKFIAGLRNGDANLFKFVVTDDFVRSLPGKSLMSGEARAWMASLARIIHEAAASFNLAI